MKLFTTLIFLFVISEVSAQRRYNDMFGGGAPEINVVVEYFTKLDSAYAATYDIEEITLIETRYEDNQIIYTKPTLVFRYDSSGKRIHYESNSWSSVGGAMRFTDYYPDSIINIQHEQYTFTDSTKFDSKFCQKYFIIDDTLSRTIRYYYQFDSLIRTEDLGIFDSKAESRNRKKDTKPVISNISSGAELMISKQFQNCLFPPLENYYSNPPSDITKDSLGRITEIFVSAYVGLGIKGRTYFIPYKSIMLEYLNEKDILKSCKAYAHSQPEKYIDIANRNKSKDENPVFPKCYLPECIFYKFSADNFFLGIPQTINISSGPYNSPSYSYKTIIKRK